MKKLFIYLSLLTFSLTTFAQNQYNIIPVPQKLIPQTGEFVVGKNTSIVSTSEFKDVANFLNEQLNLVAGSNKKVVIKENGLASSAIQFVKNAQLGDEAYTLKASSKQVIIAAKTAKGAFYGVQTLLQLLPTQVFSEAKVEGIKLTVPNCTIEDAPRYVYRGLHLDVGRHFFPVSFVKKYIDLIALHKFNTFHWHLTEDQGWRIEIKKYPKLTQIGSIRKQTLVGRYGSGKYDGKPYGGFYTQDEIKEVVAYAKTKYVNIVPEIEMPGHAQAALAAYPELGCNPDKIYQVHTTWGVSEDVFAPREETFTFLENVLTEVMALFPGQYIHIGGDECPKEQWKVSRFCQDLMKREGLKDEHELQSYFIRRIDKFITSKGRKMIGWDEILEGGLSPNATVMSWRGEEGGIAAAKENHDVIMTPGSYLYLDHYQADPKTEPLAIGGFLPLEKVYSYEPAPKELTAEQQKFILGIQANVWTEYMETSNYIEYMVFPRACAVAEVAWSPSASKNYADFTKRLKTHVERLDKLKVNYAKGFLSVK
ncbi:MULTISPECIES: beta-N-acetylhexosaminidase [unclassified Arcicella]|uniref:beta-N-acetylhexosaminidase n=1 Tax=unclassified Arcicella TaxID=2644986 RepID=UPI0028547D43|nr:MULTISPECIES: beta-N-acetylhexosaminidase [unclassified Arcicella]MDR6564767.1 hexosaminidase [Arcicella sp. BE51]MDR6814563.1 hexosaminidase [Arcicella sp. BE140]MDR6825941.1 hexosaminidase [Arcicella sp. BE139]